MKRLIILTLITILFSSAINVIMVINILALNREVVDITNDTNNIVTSSSKILNTSLVNQHIIMNTQNNSFPIYKQMFENQTQELMSHLNNKLKEITGK